MSVDYFLTDGPRVVPVEFAAWQGAYDAWYRVFGIVLDGDFTQEAQAIRLKREADRLEQIARSEFWSACARGE